MKRIVPAIAGPVRVSLAAASLALLMLLIAAPAAFPSHLDQPPNPNEPIDDPIPGHVQQFPFRVEIQEIASRSGLTAPLYGTFAPGPGPKPGETTTQPNILYVVDQDGPLWAIDTKTGAKRLFINTRTQRPLMPLGAFGPGTFDERGFLGVAFHPDYQNPGSPGFGKFYTYTSEEPGTNNDAPPPGTPPDHWNVVTEWQAADPLTPPPVRPASEQNDGDQPPPEETKPPLAQPVREVLRIGWPQFNHNGGAIFFGTRPGDRRKLYVTTGDGGCADDQNNQIGFRLVPCGGHGTGSEATEPNRAGNGQNPESPWGKIFRFNPLLVTELVIPSGDDVVAPPVLERYAFGLRNPWRASSDRFDLGGSGDVWLSDVGQNHLEEVDHVAQNDLTRPTLCPTQGTTPEAKPNFGWHFKEGTFLFNPFFYELFNPPSDGFVYANSPCEPPDMTDPVGEYDHDEGTAGIGGFVYRGNDPRLQRIKGRYIFGDYSRRFLNGNGEIFVLDETDDSDPHDATPRVFYLVNGTLPGNTFMLGFGEDAKGNLYALANETGIPFEETGLVSKIVRECADKASVNGRPDRSPDCRD
jgi:hypothetical protein